MNENTHPKYRKDIDGLRALAVILVILFHAFPEALPGGFIGVDIFFVISGFLITSILLGNLDQNKFSLLDFYSRRIRRIFPALSLILFFSIFLGWFVLFADEYRLLGRHVLASAGFFQNLNLLSETGYFDEAADTKPLLHLWSLGIEEQFYLIWPLVLWFGHKLKINQILLIGIIGFGSFGFNLMNAYSDQAFAFFSPLTRFWELSLGAALSYWTIKSNPFRRYKNISVIGFCLIIIGILIITSKSAFPGWLALLPTLGALFLIAAGEQGFINRSLLSNRAMVSLGLISYPLYLWHWVLLSFLRITEGGEVDLALRFIAIILAILLSIFTYNCVERPIQSNKFRHQKTIGLIILMLVLGFIGNNFYQRDGLAFRSNKLLNSGSIFLNKHEASEAKRQEELIDGFNCKFNESNCEYSNINNKKILVWGDSHAQMLTYGLKKSLPENWQLFSITAPGCPPKILTSAQVNESECLKLNLFASNQIKKLRPDIVLLAQRDAWDPVKVDILYGELLKMGVTKILFLGKSPEWTAKLPKIVARKIWHSPPRFSRAGLNLESLELDSNAKKLFNSTPQKHYLDLIKLLCNDDGCLVYVGDDVTTGITSFDAHHLSPAASEYVARELIIKYLD